MKNEIIYIILFIAALSFASGYLIGHDRLDIHDCQKFFDLEAFDNIEEILTNKTYIAPKF